MSRLLLLCAAEKGEINPRLGVAQWLRRLGHEVSWLCQTAPRDDQLRSLGFEVITPPGQEFRPLLEGEAVARMYDDPEARLRWARALFVDGVADKVEPLRAALRAYRPDAVAVDGCLYAGLIAAHLEKIPYGTLSSMLTAVCPSTLDSDQMRTVRALAPERDRLLRRYGVDLPCPVWSCLSPWYNPVFTTRAFVGDVALPAQTFLVGPSIVEGGRGDEPEFPWERLARDRPIVYLSFGSRVYFQPRLFALICDAAAPLGVQLVITAGSLSEGDFASRLPDFVLPVTYAPQLRLLERTAVFISHGGQNSVAESLLRGVPLLVVPICNDQPLQAHFVERSGVGIGVDPSALTVETCRAALRALLEDDRFRRRAAEVSASYRAADGARAAAVGLAALAASG